MSAERKGPEKTLEERLAEAPGGELIGSLLIKIVDDPTAGDPRFNRFRKPTPTGPTANRIIDAFPDASPEVLMDTIAGRIPTMPANEFTAVSSGITGIGHFGPDMLAPTYVRGITEISIAIGTRRAVDKMSAQLEALRTPPKRG